MTSTSDTPQKLEAPELKTLESVVKCFVEGVWSGKMPAEALNNLQQAIAVAAIEAFYGDNFTMKLAEKAMERFRELYDDIEE